MSKTSLILALLTALLMAGAAWAQSQDASLAEYARKVRAERAKKEGAKVKMYTNDNLPAATTISTVGTVFVPAEGEPAAEGGTEGAAAEGEAPAGEGEKECGESCWKGKFGEARGKVAQAEKELDIMQREYNLARTQYYQDPNQAMREQYSNTTGGGRELQDLLKRMDEKKAEIDKLKQDLSRLEDDLRKSGGQPGWARP